MSLEDELKTKIKEKLESNLHGGILYSLLNPKITDELTTEFLDAAKLDDELKTKIKDALQAKFDFDNQLKTKIKDALDKQMTPSKFSTALKFLSRLRPNMKFSKDKLVTLLTYVGIGVFAVPLSPFILAYLGYKLYKDKYGQRRLISIPRIPFANMKKSINTIIQTAPNTVKHKWASFCSWLYKWFPENKPHPLIVALRKAVEQLIDQPKKEIVESVYNLLPRFTIEDKSFAGQLKKRIKEKLQTVLITDEHRVKQFVTKYNQHLATLPMIRVIAEDEARLATLTLSAEAAEKVKEVSDQFWKQINYDTFYDAIANQNTHTEIREAFDILTNKINTTPERFKHLAGQIQQSKRILVLVIFIVIHDKKAVDIAKSLYQKTRVGSTQTGGSIRPLALNITVFYGQMLHLEDEYPAYTAKSLQKYLDIFNNSEAGKDISKLLGIKSMDDVCKKIDAIQEELTKPKTPGKPDNSDNACAAYYAEEKRREKIEMTVNFSDLRLLKYTSQFLKDTNKCTKAGIKNQVSKIVEAFRNKMNVMNAEIKIGETLTPIQNQSDTLTPNQNQYKSDTLTPNQNITQIQNQYKSDTLTPNKTPNQNQLPQDSVTPAYEAASGYDDDEGEQPEGIPVATSINPKTGKAFVDFPETVYVGNYFAYEFHEEQDPAKYKSGPWIFKEMFSVPPTIDRPPKKLVRKITVEGSENKPTIRLGTGEGVSDSLMDAGTINQTSMDKHYYEYFGKSRIIDSKTKIDKNSSMEYDDNGTQISRMKDAMFRLIQRKNDTAPIPVVAESDNAYNMVKNLMEGLMNTVDPTGDNKFIQNKSREQLNNAPMDLKQALAKKIGDKLREQLNNAPADLKQALAKKIERKLREQFGIDFKDELKSRIWIALYNKLNPEINAYVAATVQYNPPETIKSLAAQDNHTSTVGGNKYFTEYAINPDYIYNDSKAPSFTQDSVQKWNPLEILFNKNKNINDYTQWSQHLTDVQIGAYIKAMLYHFFASLVMKESVNGNKPVTPCGMYDLVNPAKNTDTCNSGDELLVIMSQMSKESSFPNYANNLCGLYALFNVLYNINDPKTVLDSIKSNLDALVDGILVKLRTTEFGFQKHQLLCNNQPGELREYLLDVVKTDGQLQHCSIVQIVDLLNNRLPLSSKITYITDVTIPFTRYADDNKVNDIIGFLNKHNTFTLNANMRHYYSIIKRKTKYYLINSIGNPHHTEVFDNPLNLFQHFSKTPVVYPILQFFATS